MWHALRLLGGKCGVKAFKNNYLRVCPQISINITLWFPELSFEGWHFDIIFILFCGHHMLFLFLLVASTS